ncbi:MAG: tyrosine-type recombinase/integrase [Chitinophagaceae bacterium]
MTKEYKLLPLFEDFIRDTLKGRRLKPNGDRIKVQTVVNYQQVLKLLQGYCQVRNIDLRVRIVNRRSQREMRVEMNYWKKFYRYFSSYLYHDRKCYDNYSGLVFKTIRSFFNYLKTDRLIDFGDFHRQFYVKSEEIPVITLLPHQLRFLIQDKEFEASLPKHLAETKDLFVFGCTVALRYSDLLNLRYRDIEHVNGVSYLSVKTIKTETPVRVKLPEYASDIILKRKGRKQASGHVFKKRAMMQINKNIRKLMELAGWTQLTGKRRKRDGVYQEVKSVKIEIGKGYRFCDLVSSHTMRRTAITTMLILGMPEHVVRKISGHAADGKAFYRYVNFVQSYLDTEIDKVHSWMASDKK